MKKLFLFYTLILSVYPLDAQRIPATLEHPATPELAMNYGKAYKNLNSSYYEFGAGLGVAALGYALWRGFVIKVMPWSALYWGGLLTSFVLLFAR